MYESLQSTPPAARFDLYQHIGEALAAQAPSGWARIAVEIHMQRNHMRVEASWFDGSLPPTPQSLELPAEVSIWFGCMREVMPLGERALWHAARFVLLANGHFDCTFDYEPCDVQRPLLPASRQAGAHSMGDVEALMGERGSKRPAPTPAGGTMH